MRGGDRGLDSRQTASILVEKIAALLGISEGAAVALNSAARRCGTTRRTPYRMGRYVIEKERHEER